MTGNIIGGVHRFRQGLQEEIKYVGLSLPRQYNVAITMIAQYQGYDLQENFLQAIGISLGAFQVASDNGSLDRINYETEYNWINSEDELDEDDSLDYKDRIPFRNFDFLGHLREKYNLLYSESVTFMIDFYVQSFVDSFNGTQSDLTLPFISREEAKRNVTRYGYFNLNNLLDFSYLLGFSQTGFFGTNSRRDLDEYRESIRNFEE